MDVLASSVATCLGFASLFPSRENLLVDADLDDNDESKRITSPASAMAVASAHRQGELITDLVAGLWPFIRIAMAQKIEERVAPRFKSLPGPLATMRFVKIDIGHVPVRLDNVVVHERNKKMLQFDLDMDWDGKCDIILKADYLGSFGIKSLKLFGRLSILMQPLVDKLPIVQAVQVAFINPPKINLEFAGLANLADVNVVRQRLYEIVQRVLARQMVLPRRRLVKLDAATSYFDIYKAPIGIARLTMLYGTGFVIEERKIFQKPDIPDCFVVATMGNATYRTATIRDDLNPVWDESMDFLLCDFDQIIHMDVIDEDGGPLDPDDFLGAADVTVGQVLLGGGQTTMELLDEGGKPTNAHVTLSVKKVTLIENLASLSAQPSERNLNEIRGLLTILIGQASRLPVEKENVSACVQVLYGEKKFETKTVSDYTGLDSLNPFFDDGFHVPLTADMLLPDGQINNIELILLNQKEPLGTIILTHDRVASAPDCVLTEKQAIGDGGASLDYRIILRGTTTIDPNPPTGSSSRSSLGLLSSPLHKDPMINFTILKAHGFRSQRFRKFLRRKNDIADPYCVVKFGSDPHPWRTKTKQDALSPVWNESKSFIFLNHGQTFRIELWDDNEGRKKRREKDDLLGMVRVTVGKILLNEGKVELETELEGRPTGIFVTVLCELLDAGLPGHMGTEQAPGCE